MYRSLAPHLLHNLIREAALIIWSFFLLIDSFSSRLLVFIIDSHPRVKLSLVLHAIGFLLCADPYLHSHWLFIGAGDHLLKRYRPCVRYVACYRVMPFHQFTLLFKLVWCPSLSIAWPLAHQKIRYNLVYRSGMKDKRRMMKDKRAFYRELHKTVKLQTPGALTCFITQIFTL